jgi:predicted nuclease of predicted toxin-antitoxin system
MSKIKLLLDEDMSAKTLKRLRRAGFQVDSVDTLKIKGMKNGILLEFATQNQYILLTHDQDFLNPSLPIHYGIVIAMIHPTSDEVAGVELEKFLREANLDELINKVTVLQKH